ncbi:hypothetical protein A0U40_13415 [[Bacillus] sp. KCTC 13219]|nr:hypothetical protein A0U40_13415 [[Bacillus] sp. KCTC 13219]
MNIEAIKERVAKATPGPWIIEPEKCGPEGQGVFETDSFGCICEVGDPYPRGNNRPQENMEFIAHAREDVPALIAEVERLKTELAKSEKCFEIMEKVSFKLQAKNKELQNRLDVTELAEAKGRMAVERLKESVDWYDEQHCNQHNLIAETAFENERLHEVLEKIYKECLEAKDNYVEESVIDSILEIISVAGESDE